MLKTRGLLYSREKPKKDAKLIIIYCEGKKREKQYFNYFSNISSNITLAVEAPEQDSKTNPLGLYEKAKSQIIKSEENPTPIYEPDDEVWFVIDTDDWGSQIDELRESCIEQTNWNVVQSNPCFEVWLYYHQFKELETFENIERADGWKQYLNTKISGGFDSKKHPIFISTAIENSKLNFENKISIGSTEIFKLAESFYPFVKDRVEEALEISFKKLTTHSDKI